MHIGLSFFALMKWFTQNTPDVIISNQTLLNIAIICAKIMTRSKAKILVTEHSTMSKHKFKSGIKNRLLVFLATMLYPLSDKVIAVSQGAAGDLIKTLHINPQKVQTIWNPFDLDNIRTMAKLEPTHPWLKNKEQPVLMGLGRLVQVKNFALMIEILAQVREHMDCRLIIYGEGNERKNLENQIENLNLQKFVSLPGFTLNPYAEVAHADILLCTSDYEGLPTSLIESLICGTLVISLDCPNGPREVLDGGQAGILINPGDTDSFVTAILSALNEPQLQRIKPMMEKQAEKFSAQEAVNQYKRCFSELSIEKDFSAGN